MDRLKLTVLALFLPLLLLACAAPPAAAPTAAPAAPAAPAQPTATPAPPVATPTLAAVAAASGPTVKLASDAKLGSLLVDAKGMTLYMYTKDDSNVSNCYDQCAQNWPPLLVASGEPIAPVGLSGKLAVITRKDGTKQVTYNGLPLYYWVKDTKPGDATGEGVGDVWHVVQPNGGAPAASVPAYSPRY